MGCWRSLQRAAGQLGRRIVLPAIEPALAVHVSPALAVGMATGVWWRERLEDAVALAAALFPPRRQKISNSGVYRRDSGLVKLEEIPTTHTRD
jgi:hypothetical protein